MTMTDNTFLLIGLGNPGREYRDNRHNVGFMLIDRLAVRLNARGMKLQSKAIVSSVTHEGRKILLCKPQTYMNLSGQSVQGLLHFYKLPLENLLVAYDELDLPFGVIRIRPGGGANGHNGLISVIERLGTQDFPRLRVGVGRPPGRMDPVDFLLQDFSKAELKSLSAILDRAADASLEFVTNGLNHAMSKFNGEISE